jgi:metal-responsive CopG/Arc/MetJ family transcriptional regulator
MTKPTKSKAGPVVRFSVSLVPEVAAKLDAYCQKRGCPKSWAIEKLITRYLEKMP